MRVLFLGDSLIEYFDWQERFPDHKIADLGMAGEPVEGLLSRVLRVKEVCPEADMIFIMSGINNVAMGDTGFIDFYRTIIERLSASYPGAKIFINSLLPVLIDFISNESVCHVNGALKKLAQDTGAGYLDIYSRFVDTKGRPVMEYLLADGVHLSRMGYDVWSNVIEQVIAGHSA
ncbi:MAG: GDSL family lipase [Nitrospirae bacterium]|nr:GDSL family lipase [Nitrospirota bacterium]